MALPPHGAAVTGMGGTPIMVLSALLARMGSRLHLVTQGIVLGISSQSSSRFL
jgi:hypothetical protein